MTIIRHNNVDIVVDDSDILLRLQEPNSGVTVNYLNTDGSTMNADTLYEFEWSDNQWFVIVNYPLLHEQIKIAVELYAEEKGVQAAVGIPIENLVECTVSDISDAMELVHCEDCE